ncbi:DUF4382 domain-containing protein [Winogradskyella schleiferi]|uniref:DUF4382 domain-containing protein n=1 Tax=Winogradskyella schleiferi TaxID=2686078 RepID=UPI0015BC683C|nr:DUF4382 domain-containing protein [Winogradskyella schleiferi]
MKHLQSLKIIVLSLMILISFSSCSKDDMTRDKQNAAITVSLKSDSGILNTVFLEINDVQVRVKEDGTLPNAWISLDAINLGTHNVSNLTNASELLLVDHFEMKPTFIHEIRLVLGDQNFIDVNDTLMSIAIAEEASVSNLVKRGFEGNHMYQVVINLDIDESVSFNEDENMTILNPKLYTEIRKF